MDALLCVSRLLRDQVRSLSLPRLCWHQAAFWVVRFLRTLWLEMIIAGCSEI